MHVIFFSAYRERCCHIVNFMTVISNKYSPVIQPRKPFTTKSMKWFGKYVSPY